MFLESNKIYLFVKSTAVSIIQLITTFRLFSLIKLTSYKDIKLLDNITKPFGPHDPEQNIHAKKKLIGCTFLNIEDMR